MDARQIHGLAQPRVLGRADQPGRSPTPYNSYFENWTMDIKVTSFILLSPVCPFDNSISQGF